MKAIVVKPGEKDSIHMRDMPDPKMKPDQVAVKMLRVGLCGTDAEINHGLYGKPPDGDEFLILGHENLGVVEEVGKKVRGWKAGDLVVSTVRRPCGKCPQCSAGENDMCSSGQYTERGIMRRHGFMAEYYVESPIFLNKIPKEIRDFAVLLELPPGRGSQHEDFRRPSSQPGRLCHVPYSEEGCREPLLRMSPVPRLEKEPSCYALLFADGFQVRTS